MLSDDIFIFVIAAISATCLTDGIFQHWEDGGDGVNDRKESPLTKYALFFPTLAMIAGIAITMLAEAAFALYTNAVSR
jgi:hypothetical protein